MSKGIDFITIRVAGFFVLCAWTVYFCNSIIWGLLLGILLFILLNVALHFIDKKRKPYSYAQLSFYFAINDNATEFVKKLVPKHIKYISDGNNLYTDNGEYIYVHFGFSPFSLPLIVKAINKAKSRNAKMLTIVTSEYDRKILTITKRTNLNVSIINIKMFMKLLNQKGELPKLEKTAKHIFSFKDLFNHANAGRFLLCGSLIAFMSIFMPIKIYYLISAGISFVLGLICLINPNKNSSEKSVLK